MGLFKRKKKEEAPPPATRAGRIWKSLKGWIVAFAMAFAILGPIRSSIADWNDVPTGSMEPTILPGDRIFVNKLAYGLRLPFTKIWLAEWGAPKAGDIVTFFSPEGGTRLVKRVVGCPGDTIELRHNRLYVNGVAVKYGPAPDGVPYVPFDAHVGPQQVETEYLADRPHPVMTAVELRTPKQNFISEQVPAGHYFMMGDNRDVSRDSRYFNFVAREQISGRSPMVALSVNPKNYYLPRLGRFFKSLH